MRDQHESGNYGLALAHYVNAALALIPADDPATCIEWASGYLRQLGTSKPKTAGSGTRIQSEVAERMRRLSSQMRRDSRYGLVGFLYAAAVQRLLNQLDAEETANATLL